MSLCVLGILYISYVHQQFYVMNSRINHLKAFGKNSAFIDLLPNSINVSTVPQKETEVRLHAL